MFECLFSAVVPEPLKGFCFQVGRFVDRHESQQVDMVDDLGAFDSRNELVDRKKNCRPFATNALHIRTHLHGDPELPFDSGGVYQGLFCDGYALFLDLNAGSFRGADHGNSRFGRGCGLKPTENSKQYGQTAPWAN